MAKRPLCGGNPAFNIPSDLEALKARDAAFWRAHAEWREIETQFEAWDAFPDECGHSQTLLDRASALRDSMLSIGVCTASALAIKLEAVREGDWMTMFYDLPCGHKVADIIESDVVRIAAGEMWDDNALAD